ncbi:MAG: outer membrane lipoprotein carrier protein LolA [Alphaproteobacteria bacterium]|jgi:outer membrane lipoprotein-sorting protein|nr:outer membrane lipoprotein carrier protein LolA [Alphaproteobacteria bacterium]
MIGLRKRALSGALLIGIACGGPAALADATTVALSDADRADIARIETYMNDLTTMESRFLQFSEQGMAEGRIFLNRPNHLRIEYAPPTPVLMIASDIILMFHDTELKQTTFLPVSETPAGFLLEETIELSGDLTITDFERSAQAFRVTLVQTDAPDSGTVTLMFEDKPLRLAKWRVVDAQGARVEVALMEPRFGVTFKNARDLFSTVDPNTAISLD